MAKLIKSALLSALEEQWEKMADNEEIAHYETQIRELREQLADLQSGNYFEADLINGQRVDRTQARIAELQDQIARLTQHVEAVTARMARRRGGS